MTRSIAFNKRTAVLMGCAFLIGIAAGSLSGCKKKMSPGAPEESGGSSLFDKDKAAKDKEQAATEREQDNRSGLRNNAQNQADQKKGAENKSSGGFLGSLFGSHKNSDSNPATGQAAGTAESPAAGNAPADAAKGEPSKLSSIFGKSAPEQEPTCFTLAFEHKAKNHTEETCSQHRNQIKLKHEKYNSGSLCVRVNGTPVRYKVDAKDLSLVVIGPVAGPKAKVTARYCLAESTCKESCNIPKDEFMDAIGGSDDADTKPKVANYGQWEASDSAKDVTAHLDKDLKRELYDADDATVKYSVYKEWEMNGETSSCLKPSVGHAQEKTNADPKSGTKG